MQHHAYYIEGPTGNYDAYHAAFKPLYGRHYERFGIDEARKLIELASLKNYQASVFLAVTPSITTEAQQALLKLFEEPQPGTTFVLVVPPGVLLATLKSRMLAHPPLDVIKNPGAKEAASFLKAAGKARSDMVAALLKDDEGARQRAREFIDALEAELYKHIETAPARAALADIGLVRGYLADRSPSLKMLLEHLAVALPTL